MYEKKELFLADLFHEMSKKGDFPSISESVWRIVAVMDMEREQFDLTQAILDDFALTQKVLRVANSAMYMRFGQNVTTVTQAVVVLGYDKIGHLAMGMKLASELSAAAKYQDARARKALSECAMAGTLARHLAQKLYAPNAEEAGVCGLLHGLGRVLPMFYLPRVWDAVESCMMQYGDTESVALKKVTGLTAGEMGQAVAAHWHIPESIVASLKDEDPRRSHNMKTAPGHSEWLAVLAQSASTLTCRLAESGYAPTKMELLRLAEEFSDRLNLRPGDFIESVERALKEEQTSPLIGLDAKAPPALDDPAKYRRVADAGAQLDFLRKTLAREADKHSIRSLFGMTMETLHRIFGSRRVVLLLKDPEARVLRARQAIGWNGSALLGKFTLESDYAPDVFHLAISHNIPVLIDNAKQMRDGGKLPAGYLSVVKDDPSFLVLPLCIGGAPVGMMYLDWAPKAERPTLSDGEKSKLVEVRDLLVKTLLARKTEAQRIKDDSAAGALV